MEVGLEVRLHVIGYLANTVTDGVSDFGVRVVTELQDSQNDRLHFYTGVKVLSDLAE